MGCGKSKSGACQQQQNLAQLTELQKIYFPERVTANGEKTSKFERKDAEEKLQTSQPTERNSEQRNSEYLQQQQQQQKEDLYLEQKRSEDCQLTDRCLLFDTERMQEESDLIQIQNLSQQINFLSSLSVIQQNSQDLLLIEQIQKMPKVYEVYQLLGDFQPKSLLNLGGTKQTGKLLENEGMYEGEWKDDKKCGFGSLVQLNIGFYQGYFENDEFAYEGRLIDILGQFFEGEWRNTKLNGIGVIKTANFHYKGEVKDGYPHGEGRKDYGKYYYQGQFQRGIKHGKGKHTFNDGGEYEGDFFENKMQGRGCYRFPNHKVYEGEFNGGKITGEGTMRWPNGSQYTGHFERGLKHGLGTFIDENGIKYSGEWIQDLQNGQFTLERDKIIKFHQYRK